jgi:serine phosphatase RsbU (regulator of sigma subunit)
MKNQLSIHTSPFNSDTITDEEIIVRERMCKILSAEYGRVLRRELQKPQDTLRQVMADGNSYSDFLTSQLQFVQDYIGDFENGESFFERMYLATFHDGKFNSITAKNLILTFRYRLENFRNSFQFEQDENLKNSVETFVTRSLSTNKNMITFNLQEKALRLQLIESISNHYDFNFQQKATLIIERQSMLVMNIMNESFITRLSQSLEQEISLKQELLKKQYLIDEDLKKARKIQQNLLPKSFPSNVGIKFYAKYIPMETVGGDFYDIQIFEKENETDTDKIGVLIADVSGHGIAAAFIAAMAKISWENTFNQYKNPSEILERLNLQMVQIAAGNFLTAFLGVFENYHNEKKIETVAKGKFHYASGGHYPPFIIRKNLDSVILKTKGQLIGVFQNINIIGFDIEYYPGDRFIFFTDGLLEAKNKKNEMLGEEELYKIFESTRDSTGDEAIEMILSKIDQFTIDKKIDDDLTLLIVDIDL